jgi:Thiolase, C-terminal domain
MRQLMNCFNGEILCQTCDTSAAFVGIHVFNEMIAAGLEFSYHRVSATISVTLYCFVCANLYTNSNMVHCVHLSVQSWAFVAVDPFEDLLLGPTFAVAKVLDEAGLTMKVCNSIQH